MSDTQFEFITAASGMGKVVTFDTNGPVNPFSLEVLVTTVEGFCDACNLFTTKPGHTGTGPGLVCSL